MTPRLRILTTTTTTITTIEGLHRAGLSRPAPPGHCCTTTWSPTFTVPLATTTA